MSLLTVKNLRVEFGHGGQSSIAVDGVDLSVAHGQRIGIVGESGSGKSVSMMAIMGLIDAPGRVTADVLSFNGQDLLGLSASARRKIIGKDIAMIFQDALSSLNPSYTIGAQLMEGMKAHLGLRGKALRERALELLSLVEIPDPVRRFDCYPHQLSGGMNQRVMIAMALSCEPKLLIADEPTTALDVTVQAQIMDLLLRLHQQHQMGLILITHDLAVVSEMTDEIHVMYAGQVMERAQVAQGLEQAKHPYTRSLLAAIPEHNKGTHRLNALAGVVPGRDDRPSGCLLSPRCALADQLCVNQRPALISGLRCHHAQPMLDEANAQTTHVVAPVFSNAPLSSLTQI
jgi:dipeptide transport system ATP-binding protein